MRFHVMPTVYWIVCCGCDSDVVGVDELCGVWFVRLGGLGHENVEESG